MSGGYFYHVQLQIDNAADQLKTYLEYVDEYNIQYTKETIDKFIECELTLRKAGIMLQRVDWLISGDDGEDSFHTRLSEDLSRMETYVRPQS